ncbi:phage protein [Lacticaseibacillus saniviri]
MAKQQYNFEIRVEVSTKSGTLIYRYGKMPDWVEIHFSVPFSDQPDKNISEVTLYNINPSDFNRINKGDRVKVFAGYTGDVGLLVSGTIYRTTIPSLEDADTAYVLRILEGQDYSKLKKQNLTFAKGASGSQIIKQVAAKAGINLKFVSLKTDKKYKDGYTADEQPMDTLTTIAGDCKTSLFYLRGQLTVQYIYGSTKGTDNFELTYASGLLQSPTREDRDEDWNDADDDDGLGKFSWSVDSILNYHMTTFSTVHVKTQYVNTTMRVLNGEHSFDGTQPTTSFEGVTQ